MTARKQQTARKPAAEKLATAPAADTAPAEDAELAWCRVGRDLEETAPECPRHEFERGARLCNLHFVTRLDLREVARNG
jgi:hypothetical protein